MALNNFENISDKVLEMVVGGLSVTNRFGNGSLYKIGFSKDNYLYTFRSSGLKTYVKEAERIQSEYPDATSEEKDKLLMEALEAIPGFLTPLP